MEVLVSCMHLSGTADNFQLFSTSSIIIKVRFNKFPSGISHCQEIWKGESHFSRMSNKNTPAQPYVCADNS